MLKRTTSVLAAALLSSCAVLPNFSETTSVSIKSVVDAVQCEIKLGTDAIRQQVPELSSWGAAYDLELQIDNKNNVALAAFDWTIPTAVATSTLSLAPTAKREVTSTRSGKLSFSQDVNKLECPPAPAAGSDLIFHGNLGVGDWLGRAAASNALYPDQLTKINYTAKFVIVMGADLKPGFKIINLTAAATAGTSQTKTNTLTLTINKPDKKASGAKQKSDAREQAEKAQTIYQLESIINN